MEVSDLTKTQRKVLKVLGDHEGEWLSKQQLNEKSGVNINHIELAIKKFLLNDLVHLHRKRDIITISLEGMGVYRQLK